MGTLKLDRSLAGFEDKANEAAQMLKALSNEKRLMILCKLLEHREMSVNALIEHVGLSQSALSQHLARMREEKLVDTRRDAQQIFYRVADPRVRRILSTLKTVYC
jgi:ArsR family transcriptional regulator